MLSWSSARLMSDKGIVATVNTNTNPIWLPCLGNPSSFIHNVKLYFFVLHRRVLYLQSGYLKLYRDNNKMCDRFCWSSEGLCFWCHLNSQVYPFSSVNWPQRGRLTAVIVLPCSGTLLPLYRQHSTLTVSLYMYANSPFCRSDKHLTKVHHLGHGFIFRPELPVDEQLGFRFKHTQSHKVMFVFVITHHTRGIFFHAKNFHFPAWMQKARNYREPA